MIHHFTTEWRHRTKDSINSRSQRTVTSAGQEGALPPLLSIVLFHHNLFQFLHENPNKTPTPTFRSTHLQNIQMFYQKKFIQYNECSNIKEALMKLMHFHWNDSSRGPKTIFMCHIYTLHCVTFTRRVDSILKPARDAARVQWDRTVNNPLRSEYLRATNEAIHKSLRQKFNKMKNTKRFVRNPFQTSECMHEQPCCVELSPTRDLTGAWRGAAHALLPPTTCRRNHENKSSVMLQGSRLKGAEVTSPQSIFFRGLKTISYN